MFPITVSSCRANFRRRSFTTSMTEVRSICYSPRRYPIKAVRRRIDVFYIDKSAPNLVRNLSLVQSTKVEKYYDCLKTAVYNGCVRLQTARFRSAAAPLRSAVSSRPNWQPNSAESGGLLITEIERRDRAWHCGHAQRPAQAPAAAACRRRPPAASANDDDDAARVYNARRKIPRWLFIAPPSQLPLRKQAHLGINALHSIASV